MAATRIAASLALVLCPPSGCAGDGGAGGDEISAAGSSEDSGLEFGDASWPDVEPSSGDDSVEVADDLPVDEPVGSLGFTSAVGDDGLTCEGASRCALYLAHEETRALEVVWQVDGAPMGDQVVKFGIEEDDVDLGFISALSAYTDLDGLAGVEVGSSRPETGAFTVRSQVDGELAVAPQFFDVVVTPTGEVPLAVAVGYEGAHELDAFVLELHHDVGCESLTGLEAVTPVGVSPPTTLDRTARILTVDKPTTHTVLVVGYDAAEVARAWTCVESVGLHPYKSAGMTLELTDRPPSWSGAYKVVLSLGVGDVLAAEPWALGVSAVLGILAEPVALLEGLACASYETEQLCAAIHAQGGLAGLTTAGEVLHEVLVARVAELTAETPWGKLIDGELVISGVVPKIELTGELEVSGEPHADGTWSDETFALALTGATLTWVPSGDCDPKTDAGCSSSVHLVELDAPVEAVLEPELDGAWGLALAPGELPLSGGALVDMVLQRVVLPHLLPEAEAGGVDSWLTFLIAVTGGEQGCLETTTAGACCEPLIAELVASDVAAAKDLANLLASQCHALLSEAAEDLDSLVPGPAEAETGELAMTSPCGAHDLDGDLTVDAVGTETESCAATVGLSHGDAMTELPAWLKATRAP